MILDIDEVLIGVNRERERERERESKVQNRRKKVKSIRVQLHGKK